MKRVGTVIKYNGRTGLILTDQNEVDFEQKDFSYPEEEKIELGDIVEFREEKHDSNVRLARNIKILSKTKK